MKTTQDINGILLFKEMNQGEAMAFLKKWRDAIEQSLSVMWSDVAVLGELPSIPKGQGDEQAQRTTT